MTSEDKTRNASNSPGSPLSCPDCQGRGWMDNRCATPEASDLCSVCNGKGFDAGGKECYACHGTGRIEVRKIDKNVCPKCRGAGVYPVPPSMTEDQFAYRPGKR